jgi:uncharacterized membrane protein YidH (DUF202 family)
MIPLIGLMIGLYVITRMISFITRKDGRTESNIVRIFSAINIIITLVILAALLLNSGPNL